MAKCTYGTWQREKRSVLSPDTRKWLITIAMAPDGRTIATNGRGQQSFRLWEVASGKERGRITGHERNARFHLIFLRIASKLAVASSDAPIYLWNTYAVQKSKLTGATLTRKERRRFVATIG